MTNSYLRSFLIGAIAGMRSLSAPAVISNIFTSSFFPRKYLPGRKGSIFKLLANSKTAGTLKVLTMGEMIADKMPGIPPRISRGPLIGRAAAGAASGAALSAKDGKKIIIGAAAGAAGAVAAAYAFYALRTKAAEKFKVKDTFVGMAEDALMIGGAGLISKLSR